jgi:hypothetical protein
MNREPDGYLAWDLAAIAKALNISTEDVLEYFTDGRRVSFILERRIAYEVLGGTLGESEGAGFDLQDAQGRKWEVRSISRGGVYFCPSYMVGSGRSFEPSGFLSKLDSIEGYILADIEAFPQLPFWSVTSEEVRHWWQAGELGTATKVSRKRALELLGRPLK